MIESNAIVCSDKLLTQGAIEPAIGADATVDEADREPNAATQDNHDPEKRIATIGKQMLHQVKDELKSPKLPKGYDPISVLMQAQEIDTDEGIECEVATGSTEVDDSIDNSDASRLMGRNEPTSKDTINQDLAQLSLRLSEKRDSSNSGERAMLTPCLQNETFGQSVDTSKQVSESEETSADFASMEVDPRNRIEDGVELDDQVATHLDEHVALALAQEEASEGAKNSLTGKAWDFVQQVIAEHEGFPVGPTPLSEEYDEADFWNKRLIASMVKLIGTDDMLFMVQRLIESQDSFAANQKDCHVDIGFHFTCRSNLKNIREHGLLTKADRDTRCVESIYNGSSYGDGIYTGSNPFAFSEYGDVGLMVARLRGETHSIMGRRDLGLCAKSLDTVIVRPSSRKEIVVLSRSCQCVPLARIQRSLLAYSTACDALWSSQLMFQKIIDRFFNNGVETMVQPWQKPAVNCTPFTHFLPVALPKHLSCYQSSKEVRVRDLLKGGTKVEKAPKIISCRRSETCPRPLDNAVGTRYSHVVETMRVSHYAKEDLSCDGEDTIVIVYTFHTQYNVSGRTNRIVFLPATPECSDILLRLKYTFIEQLMNATTWALIPHRESPYKVYPGFSRECDQSLDQFGIPCADTLRTQFPKLVMSE